LSFRLNEYEDGDATFREARALAEEIGAEDLLAMVLNVMARSPWFRARAEETQPLLEQALAIHRRLGNRPGEAQSLSGLGTIAALHGDYNRALTLDYQAVEIARATGIPTLYLGLISSYAVEMAVGGRLEEAAPWLEEAAQLAAELGDPRIEAAALHGLALLAKTRGELDTSFAGFRRVADINRRNGSQQGYALALHELGRIEWQRGRLAAAAGYLREAIEAFVARGVERWTIELIDSAAAVLLAAGEPEVAARLVGYADRARTVRDIGRMLTENDFFAQLLTDLGKALGEETRDCLMAAGALISDADARDLVLDRLTAVQHQPAPGA
jgi:tetratricopeptide (TPR) repeat protein